MTATPLLELTDISRCYRSGDSEVRALDGVSLAIWPGEFVAIMGQSGSGKSTLMNLIGCLDRPSGGGYRVLGREVARLTADELAALRRETFGFVFQRYNLLATASAEENVEMPAIYAGLPKARRRRRAQALLARLGLDGRWGRRPGQLSGGQQQRVAIARALMNDPPVILADEPTGALDSHSGAQVMALLHALHREGRTVILITHDEGIAAQAQRIVRLHDGRIVEAGAAAPGVVPLPERTGGRSAGLLPDVAEAAKTALRALRVNLFRTALTLLGIVIGVAAVVTLLAVGNGSKQKVLDQINALGTDLLVIRPGVSERRGSGSAQTLVPEDAAAILTLPDVALAVAERSGSYTLRFGNKDYATTVSGVGHALPAVRDWPLARGTFFTERDVRSYAPVIVLGQTVLSTLFAPGDDPIGRYVLVRNTPFEVIGVLAPKGATPWGTDQDDAAFVPLSTGFIRLYGRAHVNSITVKVMDVAALDRAQEAISALLQARHRTVDFRIRNMASMLETATETQNTLTVLLGTVAAISLLVGGIGVMNIMLVSVTERTREIGIRMAAGARRRDILVQFNTEAAAVCTLGGALGVALGLLAGWIIRLFDGAVVFTVGPAVLAFGCALATGLVFGYLPARKAARLDPVAALAAE